ncbi:MAG: LutC/YkgG family protein [Candidatus Limnocylindria bacterium]
MSVRPTTEFRDAMLERIRSALDTPSLPVDVSRSYRTSLPAGIDVIERFAERVGDYRARVHRSSERTLSATVLRALEDHDVRRVVTPPGLPVDWMKAATGSIELVADDPLLTHAQLDRIDAVISGCAIAIAETGTIVLDTGPGQGRRALSLLPDVLVCVVAADLIVGDVPEALARLKPHRPLTWISGPSATSDIELNRIEGVHGPRILEVIIIPDRGQH